METRYDKYEPFFGVWYIKSKIGQGASGEVYLIEREDLGTVYKSALKCISIPQSGRELQAAKAEGMSETEVRAYYEAVMNRIKTELINMAHMKGNSNVVSYEDHMIVPHEDGIGWDIMIRMELLTSFYRYCDGRELSAEDILKLGIDLSKALELCESNGIIHRDLKPDNIFVSSNGDFKLGDFGVSRTIEETRIGMSLRGTYSYMAPEVYKGEAYGPRTDIYSLGLVLYKYLNGGRNVFLPAPGTPFTQDDEDKAFFRRMSGAALPPPANGSEALKNIVLKACAYRPDDRFKSAQEMRLALEEVDYRRKYAGGTAETAGAEAAESAAAGATNTGAENAGAVDAGATDLGIVAAGGSAGRNARPEKAGGKSRIKAGVAAVIAAAAVIGLVIHFAVPKKITDITGIGPAEEILIGDTLEADYVVEPSRFKDETISFSSSDTGVLAVDQAGALTGVSVGEASVELKVKDYTESVKVKVLPKVTEITGVDSAVKLRVGAKRALKPVLSPKQFSDEPVTYTSSDKDVATVSKKGVITAVGTGKAVITISAGGCTKSVKVTVIKKKPRKRADTNQSSGSSAETSEAPSSTTSAGSYTAPSQPAPSYSAPSSQGSSDTGSSSGSSKGSFNSKDFEYFQ